MEKEEYRKLISYWDNKKSVIAPKDYVKNVIDEYILSNDTCALATSSTDYVRVTPIEYRYDKKKFYIFTEGGHKFIGLENNKNVSLTIFDKFSGFGKLQSVQVEGTAKIIDIDDSEYEYALSLRGLKKEALLKMPTKLNLIVVEIKLIDALFSKFKADGYDSRQQYTFD